ncbi:MAG: hypothetical protein NZV14_08530 [Bryobacteraceae bacterium]|nr:hypothetical protein [Bryobacteraceae bacterium]MDW8378193.1 hypothetical protein [Bryobacterales bacterium]
MDQTSPLTRLLSAARRRELMQLAVEEGSYAAAATLAAFLLLILLGTQVLDWYWPLLLAATGLLVCWYRIRKRLPSPYGIAQRLDARLGLFDALSTAFYFSQKDPQLIPRASALIEAQRRWAEAAARRVDATAALPLRYPRHGWISLALCALCGLLLVVRYGAQGSLDLRQPLVSWQLDAFFGVPKQMAQAKLPAKKPPKEAFEGISVTAEGEKESGQQRKGASDDELVRVHTVADEPGAKTTDKIPPQTDGVEPARQGRGEESDPGQGASDGEDRSPSQNGGSASSRENGKSPSPGESSANSSPPSGENSSLLEKMRDAMANMLARLKMSPQPGEASRKNMASTQGTPQQAGSQKQDGQKGAPSPGKSSDGQSPTDQPGEQQGEGESQMNMQGKTSDSAGAKQQTEGKSGAGKQEGDKDIRAAEQAAAMGKITELFGKRAKDVTGEVLVEVSSGKQRLKTDYVTRNARHQDAGGEIRRDEVPLEYQQFVQQYFEQVRKPQSGPNPFSGERKQP